MSHLYPYVLGECGGQHLGIYGLVSLRGIVVASVIIAIVTTDLGESVGFIIVGKCHCIILNCECGCTHCCAVSQVLTLDGALAIVIGIRSSHSLCSGCSALLLVDAYCC